MAKKRVLIYTENYVYGGLEKFLFDLVDGLSGHEYFLVFNQENERLREFALGRQIPFRAVRLWSTARPSGGRGAAGAWAFFRRKFLSLTRLVILKNFCDASQNLRHLRRVFRGLRDYDNLLIVNGGYPAAESCLMAAIAGKEAGLRRVVMSVLSYPSGRRKRGLRRRVSLATDRRVEGAVDVFQGNSNRIGEGLVGLRGFAREKVSTVYTGIEVPVLQPKVSALENGALSLRKGEGESWVGMTGRLEQRKGQRYLVEAVKELRGSGRDVRCLLVGDGPDRDYLAHQADALGIAGAVVLAGRYPSDISDIYAFLDVFVFASLYEGLPYAVSEAMAHHLPVVSTNVGGIPEQIEDGVNGLLVDPGRPDQLAEKVAWLLDHPGEAGTMAGRARLKVEAHFSLAAMVGGMDGLLV